MDSYYEYAGATAASALHDVLSGLGIPLILAAAGVAYRFYRVAEDGIARPLLVHFLSLLVLVWLVRPVEIAEGVRIPRFVQIAGDGADLAVKASIERINKDFLTRPFEYERVAALAGRAHVQDPKLREKLHIFLGDCTQNAMAVMNPASARAWENPIAPDTGLPYEQFRRGGIGPHCEVIRMELWDDLRAELDRYALHQAVLKAVGPSGRDAYLDTIVRNERDGRVADGGEMALVRKSVGSYDGMIAKETIFSVEQFKTGSRWKDLVVEAVVPIFQAAVSVFAKKGQGWSDEITARQRYYLVTAHAPYLYGLILMLLISFFPIVGLWSLLPGKWIALVNYGKVFLSVKLWPIGWALISSFSAQRPVGGALAEDAAAGDVLVASSLLYFMIPGLSFLVMHLATTAAAIPFRDATPAVVGASNGPVGAVAMVALRKVT